MRLHGLKLKQKSGSRIQRGWVVGGKIVESRIESLAFCRKHKNYELQAAIRGRHLGCTKMLMRGS